ncbi:MAG: ATPase V [Bacteroidales bacterium]|nr:ATPase V [Bacteroidales bacterium]
MITPMTKYSFILLNGEQQDLLEKLQELGLVDITRDAKGIDDQSRELWSQLELIDGLVHGLENAKVPEGTIPERIDGDIVRLAGGMLMRYAEDTDAIKNLNKERDAILVWGNYDPEILRQLQEAGVPVHFHCVSKKAFKPEWEQEYALSIVAEEKNRIWFVAAGDDDLPGELPKPQMSLEQKEKEIREREAHYQHLMQRLASAKERIPELKELRSQTFEKLDLHLAGCAAVPAAEDTLVTLVGYAPEECQESVTAALDASGVFYLKDAAQVEDNPPITFRNNKFVKMFETLTDMYGRPAYDGFDPTPFISVFFLLFFAFCMGDAGYGLILVLVGLLLKKVPSFKDMAGLVVTLGIGTVVIGFFFHTFFSMDISQWEVFAPIKGIFLPAQIAGNDATMVLALAVGILHICLAMVVKTIHETRTKGFAASLGTWGWTLLVVGGVTVAAFALAGVLDAALTKWIVIVLGVVSALGIFVFNDPKRNKLANIGMGLWDTYNMITGLVGDVLSYIRLYALGLAGSMLGMAFNDMGVMILGDSPNIGKWIGFLLLIIFGHTLNIAMCALGAFVHPLRLNFLEFFKNAGYEANGRAYNPLKKSLNKQ